MPNIKAIAKENTYPIPFDIAGEYKHPKNQTNKKTRIGLSIFFIGNTNGDAVLTPANSTANIGKIFVREFGKKYLHSAFIKKTYTAI